MRPALLASLSLVAVAPLAAQRPGRVDTLPDIVATATRLPTPPGAVVATRTVLDGAELRARGVRFVLDALRDVPGMAIVPGAGAYGAQTSLFLRGGNSDQVKVLVDGVPLNQPGGLVNLANLTTDNLDRIEVVRGPASVLYGADAMTGVVQLFTRAGRGRPRGSLQALGGTFGTSQLEASAAGGGRAQWSASVGRVGSAGLYRFNNGYRNTVASTRLATQLGGRLALAATGRFSDARYEFPTDFAGVPSDSNQATTERLLALGVDGTLAVGRRLDVRLQLTGAANRSGFDDASDAPGDTAGYGFAARSRSELWRGGADLRAVLQAAGGVTVVGGLSYERESESLRNATTSNFGAGAFTEASTFEQDRETVAPYAQVIAELPAGLAVNAGARHDANSAFGGFETWRAALAWQVRRGTRLRVGGGSAFKAPKFREQFLRSAFEVGDPDLRPERSLTWEAGLEQALGPAGLAVAVTAFRTRFRDLIQYQYVAADAPTYANLSRAQAQGVEVEIRAEPWRGVRLAAEYTYLETRVTEAGAGSSPSFAEGEALLRRPAHTGRLRAAWQAGRRVDLGANVNLVGARADVDFNAVPATRVSLDGYALVELTADVLVLPGAPGQPEVGVLVRLENLLDARYQPVLGFPGRGRAVLAGARVGL